MKIKLLGSTKLPQRKLKEDAGYDLYMKEDVVLKSHQVSIIDTGICLEIPSGYCGRLVLRSSINAQDFFMKSSLIDSNFRGEIKAIVYNNYNKDITWEKDKRYFSLYIFPVFQEELQVVDKLSESERNDKGFGSTGK